MTLTDARTPADRGATRGVAAGAGRRRHARCSAAPSRPDPRLGRQRGRPRRRARPSCVRDAAALRRLVFRPGELGLAQAYVTGEIDVEGDLLDGFRRVWQAVRESGASPRLTVATVLAGAAHRQGPRRVRPPAGPAGVAGPAARPAALADAGTGTRSRTTTTCPTTSTR